MICESAYVKLSLRQTQRKVTLDQTMRCETPNADHKHWPVFVPGMQASVKPYCVHQSRCFKHVFLPDRKYLLCAKQLAGQRAGIYYFNQH